MNLKKPKFWDLKKPNLVAYILFPISYLIQSINFFLKVSDPKKFKIKTICLGNIYLGGTGKTSLSIAINKLLTQKKIKSCFVKKFYKNQIDEQKLLSKHGKLFLANKRTESLIQAQKENFEIAILDDGLQDNSIDYDIKFLCFNTINWIGNGMTIPAGPLREKISSLKNYKNIFLNGNLENIEKLKDKILSINPNINIHLGQYQLLNIKEFNLNDKFFVFSGIGNHQTFINMIKNFNLNKYKTKTLHIEKEQDRARKVTREVRFEAPERRRPPGPPGVGLTAICWTAICWLGLRRDRIVRYMLF